MGASCRGGGLISQTMIKRGHLIERMWYLFLQKLNGIKNLPNYNDWWETAVYFDSIWFIFI